MSLKHYNSERSGVLVGTWTSEDLSRELVLEKGGRGYFTKDQGGKLSILWTYSGETLSIRHLSADSGYGKPEYIKLNFPENIDSITLDPPYRRIKRFKRQ